MSNPSTDPAAPGFWGHKGLDELATEQGVHAIEDFQRFLDEIGDVWPDEESVDEFIAWLAETRRMG
jgi:hypothetical protein